MLRLSVSAGTLPNMDTFWGVPLALWGGIIGSTLTYAITYFRERRKLIDAYRAPQREAVGSILAAADALKVAANDVVSHARQPIFGAVGKGTSNDAAILAERNFERALLEVDRAFAVGRLTVVHPQSFLRMMEAYGRYSNLRNSLDLVAVSQRSGWEAFMKSLNDHLEQLDADCAKLVAIGQDQLSPKQGWLKTAARKGAITKLAKENAAKQTGPKQDR